MRPCDTAMKGYPALLTNAPLSPRPQRYKYRRKLAPKTFLRAAGAVVPLKNIVVFGFMVCGFMVIGLVVFGPVVLGHMVLNFEKKFALVFAQKVSSLKCLVLNFEKKFALVFAQKVSSLFALVS
ncbi:hypothetical protein PGT21_026576 [Puccinia graminis f. sp. tritici]|uniref:Transmembrane protein n=1 Tax=Puccinia graminis f. sp. tritici TaxID=56615 RepID=A0A5B0PV19_PUCGR|nr:hypothetical protein PGTUg99_013326 [Puccinia graminis f. sp. tritici]KAA1104550.1 hypothetical protein PGT21_026576 [Puccinia graminis f. sp. tritici]